MERSSIIYYSTIHLLFYFFHHFHIDCNTPCQPPKILHSHCLLFNTQVKLKTMVMHFFFLGGGGVGLNKVGLLWSMRKLLTDDAIGSPENSFIVQFDTTLPSLGNNVKMAKATRITLTPPSLGQEKSQKQQVR